MRHLWSYLKYKCFKLYLMVLGVRFFRATSLVEGTLLERVEMTTVLDKKAVFTVTEHFSIDIEYILGRFKECLMRHYVVHMTIDPEISTGLYLFNNMRLAVSDSCVISNRNRDILPSVLIEIYLDYIAHRYSLRANRP